MVVVLCKKNIGKMSSTAQGVENSAEEQSVLTFDDSLFDNDDDNYFKSPTPAPSLVMQPNMVNPRWFMSPETDESPQTIKYRGDFLFYKKEYQAAAKVYMHCVQRVPVSNRTLLRDAVESEIWCFLKLGDFEAARKLLKGFTEELVASSTTFEQRTPSLFLSAQLYKTCSFTEEYTVALKKGLCVHPLYPEWWLELGKILLAQTKDEHPDRAKTQGQINSFGCKFARLCLGLANNLALRQELYSSSFAVSYAQIVCQNAAELLKEMGEDNLNIDKCVEHLLERSTDMQNSLHVENFEQTILKWSETTTDGSNNQLATSLSKVELK